MVHVGQRLYKERIQKKLTIDEIAKATRIKPVFLQAIERGEYDKLPSPAYAIGFVRNYADYLGLPKAEITALFRREFDEKKAYKVLPDSLVKTKEFPIKRLQIQQSIFVIIFFLVLLAGYLLFQYRFAYLAPALTIDSIKQSVNSQEVTISGITDSNATVTINNEPAIVGNTGKFLKKIILFPGKTAVTISAKNRMGKETVLRREIEVKP
jgi:cytoskeletal protein RodZ